MSLILSLQCDVADCQSKIHGEEAIELGDLPPRAYTSFDAYANLGHKQLNYAEDLEEALQDAALAAGWHRDGREWRCLACIRKAIIAGDLPTVAKIEALAHSFNL